MMIYEFAIVLLAFLIGVLAAVFPAYSYIPMGIGLALAFEFGKSKEKAK